MTPAKRSTVYDEIGERLGQGRKARGDRREVSSPPGVSQTTKKMALERAKALVIHRHFAEVRRLFADEVEFLKALDEWYAEQWPDMPKPSESGSQRLLDVTEMYYRLNKLEDEGSVMHSDGAVQTPIFMPDGRPRPRPKKVG